MKKVITICLMVVTLLVGGMTVEAKTTKKKGKARTTQISKKSSGLAEKIIGHTYENKKYELQWTFFKNGIGKVKFTDLNRSQKFKWEQDGKNNIVIYGVYKYIDARAEISSDGKKLIVLDFADGSEFIMKIIK